MVTFFASSVNFCRYCTCNTLGHLTLSLFLLLCKTLSKKVIRTYYQVCNSFDFFFTLHAYYISCQYFEGRIALFTAQVAVQETMLFVFLAFMRISEVGYFIH